MRRIYLKRDNITSLFDELSMVSSSDYMIVPESLILDLEKVYDNFFADENINLNQNEFLRKSLNFFCDFLFVKNKDVFNINTRFNLSSKILRSIYFKNFKNKTYKFYLQAFEYYDMIKLDKKYSTISNKSNTYIFNKKYYNSENYIVIVFEDLEMINNKCNVLDLTNSRNEVYINTIKNLQVDLTKYIEIEYESYTKHLNINKLIYRVNSVLRFNNNKLRNIHYGNKVNRLYHSICYLPKESRQCFNIKFNCLDIVNCQPLLLCYYLLQEGFEIDNSFINDVENGVLYESLQEALLLYDVNMERKDIKVFLYSEVLFYFKTNDMNKVNKVFSELYPLVYSSISKIHKKNKNEFSLASRLQNLESELFNNLKIIHSKYYYTLFDAVYYSCIEDELFLKEQIEEYFKKLNLRVTISK